MPWSQLLLPHIFKPASFVWFRWLPNKTFLSLVRQSVTAVQRLLYWNSKNCHCLMFWGSANKILVQVSSLIAKGNTLQLDSEHQLIDKEVIVWPFSVFIVSENADKSLQAYRIHLLTKSMRIVIILLSIMLFCCNWRTQKQLAVFSHYLHIKLCNIYYNIDWLIMTRNILLWKG